ncbi:MAG: adenylate/guanylate cyclase domain-containing protein [bacterium]|nr:adenylate/guanylate cyclase domain-containing protein [bacterium]
MIVALIVGIAALALSVVAAVILGLRIARPIVRISAAAGQVRDLDISEIDDLPASVFRELDRQSGSFDAMLRALRWFEVHIPKKVVERLVKRGDIDDTMSSVCDITVMFTDIAGFSSVAENLSAPEVAALVNRHFAIVAGCIEAEDGTVDKFIGDSVMAFLGAPDAQPDAAERACRAALAIADGIRRENLQRRTVGQAALGIRIGVHSGSATVDNIGAPGRINYTIIGDAVNVDQRLEQFGRTLYPEASETAMLISGATAAKLGPEFHPVPAAGTPSRGAPARSTSSDWAIQGRRLPAGLDVKRDSVLRRDGLGNSEAKSGLLREVPVAGAASAFREEAPAPEAELLPGGHTLMVPAGEISSWLEELRNKGAVLAKTERTTIAMNDKDLHSGSKQTEDWRRMVIEAVGRRNGTPPVAWAPLDVQNQVVIRCTVNRSPICRASPKSSHRSSRRRPRSRGLMCGQSARSWSSDCEREGEPRREAAFPA